MTDISKCLEIFDNYLFNAAKNPFRYGSSPHSMEQTFLTVDSLRQNIANAYAVEGETTRKSYSEYLNDEGCGTALFSTRCIESNIKLSDDDLFRKLGDFLLRYLAIQRNTANENK